MLQALARTELRHLVSYRWKPHSRLFIVDDGAGWTLSWEGSELSSLARQIGIDVVTNVDARRWADQCVFMLSRYFLLSDAWLSWRNRIAVAYYHGLPGTGVREFDRCFEALQTHHDRIAGVQVTNHAMREVILSSGIDESKVFLIRIGVNLDFFPFGEDAMRRNARRALAVPESAFVVGSFLKDGDGFGEGDNPKHIKGPDVFLRAIAQVRRRLPELHVLLSGPARGFVRKGLRSMGVPFTHVPKEYYPDIAPLYHASDVCLVASRQEGGPKSILEAMATGTPIVSTRVGQAPELIEHGVNGWLADVEDVEALVAHVIAVKNSAGGLEDVRRQGRKTAEVNSYVAQTPQWRAFFNGFLTGAGS